MKTLSLLLLYIGGVNWGLVGLGELTGLGNLNLVNIALGSVPALESIVYLLVGISALMLVFGKKKGSM